MLKKYRTGELLTYLGVSRDTLRYYEEKGLLHPKKSDVNRYRDYDIYDVYTIMIIDFYKKRGMSIQQIQALLANSDIPGLMDALIEREEEIKNQIHDLQAMLKRIESTKRFARDIASYANQFIIRPMPVYTVNGEISDFIAVEEYESVLEEITSNQDDMLSQIMRYISFDKDGVTGTKMLIVSSVQGEGEDGSDCLNHPHCLYTIEKETQPQNDRDLMKSMHASSYRYAQENGLNLSGEAYALIRLITNHQQRTTAFMEIYIPFEKI